MKPRAGFLSRLRACRSGVAMTEFALAAPLLMTVGLWGTEVAWLALTHLRISQVAMQIADNASRVGDTSTLENKKIYESDIDDVFRGSDKEAGTAIDLYNRGRVIISSLEVVPGTQGQQYIHWQRCLGAKQWPSTYGSEGDGLTGPEITGMGPAGDQVTAYDNQDAVIFVEISYEYHPLFSKIFVGNTNIHVYGAFNVRDSRDLTQIYQRDPNKPDPIATCDKYTAALT
ncbi:MAG: TadE/TadG family type IV pilus assembly protein [Croceibacterium sp.]